MGTWKTRASAVSVAGACVFALVTGAGAVFAGDWWGQHHGPVVVQFINGPAGDSQAKQSHAGRVHARRSRTLTKSTVPAEPESDVNKPYPQTSQVSPAPLRATSRAAPTMAPCGSTMAETGPRWSRPGPPRRSGPSAPAPRPRRRVPRHRVPRHRVPRRRVPRHRVPRRRVPRRQVPRRRTRRQAQYRRAGDHQAGDRQTGDHRAGDRQTTAGTTKRGTTKLGTTKRGTTNLGAPASNTAEPTGPPPSPAPWSRVSPGSGPHTMACAMASVGTLEPGRERRPDGVCPRHRGGAGGRRRERAGL